MHRNSLPSVHILEKIKQLFLFLKMIWKGTYSIPSLNGHLWRFIEFGGLKSNFDGQD